MADVNDDGYYEYNQRILDGLGPQPEVYREMVVTQIRSVSFGRRIRNYIRGLDFVKIYAIFCVLTIISYVLFIIFYIPV